MSGDERNINWDFAFDSFYQSSLRILHFGSQGLKRIEFMKETSEILQHVYFCDAAEFWLQDDKLIYRWMARFNKNLSYQFRILDPDSFLDDSIVQSFESEDKPNIELLGKLIFSGRLPTNYPPTLHGSFIWIEDTDEPIEMVFDVEGNVLNLDGVIGSNYGGLIFIPFKIDKENRGLLLIKFKDKNPYNTDRALYFSTFAQTFGLAVADRRAQYSLRERVKEMTCLYNLSEISHETSIDIDSMLSNAVEILPPAWQYPELASARIIYDNKSYTSKDFRQSSNRLISNIVVNGEIRGTVEISYRSKNQELEMGYFLSEERKLIDTVAKHLGIILERRHSLQEKEKLQKQLRHADRLATIGQLAAGVAHELNEPMNSILGYAELIKDEDPNVAEKSKADLDRIINAVLHAREVVRKMLVFAREVPVQNFCYDINSVIEEGLYFINSRCQKEGIELIMNLSENLPMVSIDTGQIHQVIVNLVINAIQAMDKQEKEIEISTRSDGDHVILEVIDNGCGMTEAVKEQIFIPFYTTKDIGQGTGLGLPVVYGIISSVKGHISVNSQVGKGSKFTVELPICKDEFDEGQITNS